MSTMGWMTKGALLACLVAVGCESADSDNEGTGTRDGELGQEEQSAGHANDGPGAKNPAATKPADKPVAPPLDKPAVPSADKPVGKPPVVPCEPSEGDAGSGSTLSCANVRCRAGTQCVEQPTGPACVPIAATIFCPLTLCPANTKCVEGPNSATCVPITTLPTCAVTLCAANTNCVDGPKGAECVPIKPGGGRCLAALCPTNTQCIDGPAGVECVPLTRDCSTVKCAAGTHCEVTPVQCIRAPCPAITECVPD
jgi:hypothetical protein